MELTKNSGIEELDLSVRAYNNLHRGGIRTIDDLIKKSTKDLIKFRDMGSRTLGEILLEMDKHGFRCVDCSYDEYPDIEKFLETQPHLKPNVRLTPVFACDACHSLFSAKSQPEICPHCGQTTVSWMIVTADKTNVVSSSAVRPATLIENHTYENVKDALTAAENAKFEYLKSADIMRSNTVRFISLLLQHGLSINEHNLALVLGYNFLTSPIEYTKNFILSVLNPSDAPCGAGSIPALTMAGRYNDLRKLFSSEVQKEKRKVGDIEYERLYRSTWADDALLSDNNGRLLPTIEMISAGTPALNFMKYFKEAAQVIALHTPNRRNITNIPCEEIAEKPSNEYKAFLQDWYNML